MVQPAGMTTIDIKYKTQPHDGTPGKPWEDFEERLMDVAAGVNDERGRDARWLIR